MSKILLVGAGPMALNYAKVLKALGVEATVVGRGEDSAARIETTCGIPVFTGGIEKWLSQNKDIPRQAIVAVNESALGIVAILLIEHGVKFALVEKPGAATPEELNQVFYKATEKDSKVYVGYNRRFYSSVQKAKEIIKKDGGVVSFNFEFTEWSHIIKDLHKEPETKANWFFHNSTHVIDLAFYLGGRPREISCYTAGGLDWHPTASIFSGAGISENGALFSYQANWDAPGRWGVEVLTRKHRLIFRPLEKLQIQKIGSVAIDYLDVEDKLDTEFKPGLFRQTEAFIQGKKSELVEMREQMENTRYYQMINNGRINSI